MPYKRTYFFYQCYNCGQWYYSEKLIKVKKCVTCNRSFQFKKSQKFTKSCLPYEAIEITKILKKSGNEESQIKLGNINHFQIKKGFT